MTRRAVLTVAAVPFALALALGASSERLVDRWWPTFPHERLAASADGSVTLRDTVEDPKGRHPRVVTMRYVSIQQVTTFQDEPGDDEQPVRLPSGQVMWRLVLHYAADPDTIVGSCVVQVRDEHGREYAPGVGDAVEDAFVFTSCTPVGAPGPMAALSKDEVPKAPDPPRPAEYDRWYHVIMPAGVEPHDVRVWFDTPRYAEFPVPDAGAGSG